MTRRSFEHSPETKTVLALVAGGLVVLVVAWAGAALAGALGASGHPPANPLALPGALRSGRFAWRLGDTVGACVVLCFLAGAGGWLGVRRARAHERHAIDRRAKMLLRDPKALRRYTDPRLGPATEAAGPGLPVGVDVVSRATVRATWESVGAYIAAARQRKTTSWVVPMVLAAPGPAFVTSNKRDVVDLTAELRGKAGRTWIYDPQEIAGGSPTWWWNPLDLADDVAGAQMLAGIFAAATRPVGANMDSYFDPEGEALLAMMLLAAHRATKSMADVYRWLTDPVDDQAARALRSAGHDLAAAGVQGVIDQPDRQRAGVFGTAKKMVQWTVSDQVMRWCVDDGTDRPRFSASAFAESTDTVYALSREGPGSAGPLTAAFTAAVARAAERTASGEPGGRLAVPMVMALDEVANVCRWRELPDLYSHYGSRGICVHSFLQSWHQGVECWGDVGMRKLWGAANVCVYGGGQKDAGILEDLSRLCGEVDVVTHGVSDGRGGTSRSQSFRRERVFDPGLLHSLPPGRVLVLLSGAPPVVVRPVGVWEGPFAGDVKAVVSPALVPAGVR